MRLRVRHPNGQLVISDTSHPTLCNNESSTLAELQRIFAIEIPLAVELQQLLVGYPPREIVTSTANNGDDDDQLLSEIGIVSGETVIVRAREVAVGDCSSTNSSSGNSGTNSSSSSSSNISCSDATTSPSVPLTDGRYVVRRVIADDNSCCFNAVSYCLDHRNRQGAPLLRQVVASIIASNTDKYTSAFLGGKSNQEYVSWIMESTKWAGGIELDIMAQYYSTLIVVVNVQTGTVYRFGEGHVPRHKQQCVLLHTGIHYDSVAVTAILPNDGNDNLSSQNDETGDVTVFPIVNDDKQFMTAVMQLATTLRQHGDFTDVATFALRCQDCGVGLSGGVEAQQHAGETGHRNFVEFTNNLCNL
jgi:ubiquitin thioesterase OTU1